MPRAKGSGIGASTPVTVRLGADELAFFRREANLHGRPLATHIAMLLSEGVITQRVIEIESRLEALIRRFPDGLSSAAALPIPDELLFSVFVAEAMLVAIVEQRDTQALYAAQQVARRKVAALKERLRA